MTYTITATSDPDSIFNLYLDKIYPDVIYNASRAKVCTQYPFIGSLSVRDNLYAG